MVAFSRIDTEVVSLDCTLEAAQPVNEPICASFLPALS